MVRTSFVILFLCHTDALLLELMQIKTSMKSFQDDMKFSTIFNLNILLNLDAKKSNIAFFFKCENHKTFRG